MHTLTVRTTRREELIDITASVQQAVSDYGLTSGAVLVFCPHTTAALTINENADPDVKADMTAFLARRIPRSEPFAHMEGNSDAHIKTALMGQSSMIIVEEGRLCLGRWQSLYLCEWDGARSRSVYMQFLRAEPPA